MFPRFADLGSRFHAVLVASALALPLGTGDDAAALVKQLSNSDERKVSAALDGLRKLGPEGVDGLVQATKHKQIWVRASAWRWIGELGGAGVAALPELVKAMPRAPRDEWASSRELAFVISMQTETIKILVKGLPFDFKDADSKQDKSRLEKDAERVSALVALGKVGAADPAALLALIEKAALPLDQGYCDLHAGFAVAAANGEAKGYAAIERGLASPSTQVQAASLLACCVRLSDTGKLADAIVKLLASPEPGVRGLAAEALFRVRHPCGGVQPRLVELCQDPSPFVRVLAARSVGFGCAAVDATVPTLVELLAEKSTFARMAAIDGLETLAEDPEKDRKIPSEIRPKTAVEPLACCLTDAVPDVRRRAAEALGNYGEVAKSALPALRRAAKDPEPKVREAAESAIGSLEKP